MLGPPFPFIVTPQLIQLAIYAPLQLGRIQIQIQVFSLESVTYPFGKLI